MRYVKCVLLIVTVKLSTPIVDHIVYSQ